MSRDLNKPSPLADFSGLGLKPFSYRVHYPYSHYVLGAVSLWLASRMQHHGWSANAVTALNFALLATALTLIAFGGLGSPLMVAGVLALQGVLVLDNVDGLIARATGGCTKSGALADAIVSWAHYSILPVCIGWSLATGPAEDWQGGLGLAVPGTFWLATGVLRAVACLVTVAIGGRYRKARGSTGYEQLTRAHRTLLAVRFAMEAEALLLLLAVVLDFVGILHLAYCLLQLAVMAVVVVKCSRA